MMHEYFVKDFDPNPGVATHWLNVKADDGWEVVNIFPDVPSQKWIVVMKKAKLLQQENTLVDSRR